MAITESTSGLARTPSSTRSAVIKLASRSTAEPVPAPVDHLSWKLEELSGRADRLSWKLQQLEAMLTNCSGQAHESFEAMDSELRDAYLSHCADLAGAARREADAIVDAAKPVR